MNGQHYVDIKRSIQEDRYWTPDHKATLLKALDDTVVEHGTLKAAGLVGASPAKAEPAPGLSETDVRRIALRAVFDNASLATYDGHLYLCVEGGGADGSTHSRDRAVPCAALVRNALVKP